MAHMTRDDGWRFLSLGRHLERLHFVSSTLGDVAPEQASAGSGLLEWLLELSDSLLTYRVRHMQHPEWESVVDLMLARRAQPALGQVPARRSWPSTCGCCRMPALIDVLAEVERLLHDCRADVDARAGRVVRPRRASARGAARRDASSVSVRLGSALSLRYFSHVDEVPRATVGV